ncbi:MAG TPA: glycosyltransferase family 39 protein, partial [Chloroflexota bacterium]|nr:glycosyltransferase family 39 protein [Chloroflexota bacterium]
MNLAIDFPARRRAATHVVLGATAIALAVAGQSLVSQQSSILDGVILYSTALLIGMRALILPERANKQRGHPADEISTSLSLTNQKGSALAIFAIVANLMSLFFFGNQVMLNLAWVLFTASVIATPVAIWLLSGDPRPRPFAGWSRPDAWTLGLILVAGLFFRLHQIDSLPAGLWWDEAFSGQEALKIIDNSGYRPVYAGGFAQGPALIWYTMVPPLWLFGPTPLGVRATAIVGGMLGILAVFLLGRELFGRRTGYVAAAMLAMMTWHVNFSRISFNCIWSVALNALAAYFLVQALRTRRLITFALAGLSLGLSLHMYYTSRLLPMILVLYVLNRVVREKRDFLRNCLPGLLVTFGATLIVISPLAQFAILNPTEFRSRLDQVSIFREVSEKTSVSPVVENLGKHLLMFHVAGDSNGRHNLPGAPMLDPVIGALLILGLAMAIGRAKRSEIFILLVWIPIMLAGGVLSLSFEAPQALRTIDNVTAVVLLAALPLVALWNRLDELPLGTFSLGSLRSTGQPLPLQVGALTVLLVLFWIGSLNYQRYFVTQAHDFAVWASFSTAETEVARQINTLPSSHRIYLGERMLNHPTVTFLTGGNVEFNRFDPSSTLPIREAENVAIFVDADGGRQATLARQLYPLAETRTVRSPAGNPTLLHSVFIPREQVERLQGVTISYFEGADWAGQPSPPERRASFDLDWRTGARPKIPFSAEIRSTLVAPTYGSYTFKFEAPPQSELLLNETIRLTGGEEKTVVLARGRHALRAQLAMSEVVGVQLLWRPPGAANHSIVPGDALFVPPVTNNGLLGSYYPNQDWSGDPNHQQIESTIDWRVHILPLRRPYSVEWTGKIDIPR